MITSKPGIPFGVKLVAGSSPAFVTFSTIDVRSSANASARRWFTSGTDFRLKPR